MKKFNLFLGFFLISFFITLNSFPNLSLANSTKENLVYIVSIEGIIDLGLSRFIKRVIKEAEPKAVAIIFEINTLGGQVDAATQIKDVILDTSLLTIAYVNKRAISAGALIALSAKKIIMAPGSSIGAVEPRPRDEKSISFVKAEMVSTALKTGRPKELAEAMVDKNIEIEGLVKKGELLTLSWQEALNRKFAESEASNMEEVLRLYNLEKAKVIKVNPTWSEDLFRFLIQPIVSSLLLSLGFIGLLVELRAPSWGLAGIIGITCLALFFGSHFMAGLADWIHIFLFIFGLILIIVEVFLVPGFSITGIGGIICLALSLILSFKDLKVATFTLSLTFILTIGFSFLLFKYLPKTYSWQRLILKQDLKEDLTLGLKRFEKYLNKEGYAITPLHPSGICLVEGEKLDVITQGGFLSAQTKVKVVKTEGSKIVVTKIEEKA
ncbi:nodulation protein NfeD [bacterium]|nr:nodulation protein NfeD [bacterium]MBU1153231.1 nodulation protein NfeD [bacterium]